MNYVARKVTRFSRFELPVPEFHCLPEEPQVKHRSNITIQLSLTIFHPCTYIHVRAKIYERSIRARRRTLQKFALYEAEFPLQLSS